MRLIHSSLALILGCSLSGLALAESKSSSFNVGVEVLATCSISAADMTFSQITTGTSGATDAAADISVNCSQNAPYAISLSNGSNYSGGRRLKSGSSFINYSLFSDPSRAQAWDSSNTVNFVGSGTSQAHTVYGRIPAGQTVRNMGSYADTVVATVSY